MNKKLFKIIVIILLIVLFVPDVKAAIKSIHNISPEENVTYISYDKTAKEVFLDLGKDGKVKGFMIGDLNKSDNNRDYSIRKFLYYKEGLKEKNKDNLITKEGDIATLTIKDAAYWCENNFCKSDADKKRLNIKIKLNSVKIKPTVIGDNVCKTKYKYGLFSYNITNEGVNVFSSTRAFYNSTNKKKDQIENYQVPTDDTKNCGANVILGYTITLEGSLPDGAFKFVWTIKDIDQPDKSNKDNFCYIKNNDCKKEKYNYVEAISFNSGFISDYYVYANSLLKNSGTKFIATEQTGHGKQPPVEKSTVLTFQNLYEANISWYGSRDVETTIMGDNIDLDFPPPPEILPDEYEYTGDYCDAGEENKEISCGESGLIEDTVDSINGEDSLLYTKPEVTFKSTKHTSCNYENDIQFNMFFKEKENGDVTIVNSDGEVTNYKDKCVPVIVNVPIVMLENMKLSVGTLDSSVYAGGGINWDTTTLTNSIDWKWRYQRRLKGSGDPYKNAFLIQFSHRVNNELVSDKYFTLSDVEIYTDPACSEAIDDDKLNRMIEDAIHGSYSSDNVGLDKKFKATTDYNDAESKNATIPLKSEVNTVDDKTFVNSVSLKNAYINSRTANITYDNEETKDSEYYIDSGSRYYVPLKYTDDTFSIFLGSADKYKDNLSAIGQTTKSFSVKCDVDVKHIFYEKKKNKLQLAFRYRPIKEVDVFNGKNKKQVAEKAQNWVNWYCTNDLCNSDNNNRKRIANTYNNSPIYSITFGNGDEYAKNIGEYNKNNNSYADFSLMKYDGTSSFVKENMGFKFIASSKSYCPLGKLLPSGCDEIVSG